MRVEVVYALPQQQRLIALEVAEGTTAAQALTLSGVMTECREAADRLRMGIFGRTVEGATVLRDGDRVEVYRALLADPKEVRRTRVLAAKSRGC
ncbi:RnfH family protein [Chitinivorax sp. PXF-14]|uniref:RnfH family protein n=1 Tax=Chitinivorax sp. PXF-14 TaxID=3230488 RepID=UPI00346663D4